MIPGPRGGDLIEPPDDGRSRQTALQERKGDKENIKRYVRFSVSVRLMETAAEVGSM